MNNPIRALLFPDWDLESLLANVDPTREDEFSVVVASIQAGQLAEAEEWLANEIASYPWVLLAAAHVKMKMNEPSEAGRLLRAVTLISNEARLRLWAWHSLRTLGKYPAPDLARQALGVVIEVPFEKNADVLAAYADGTARYINHQGGMIVWDRADEVITPKIMAVIKEAQPEGVKLPLSEPQEERPDEQMDPTVVRLSVLSPGGISVWEGVPGESAEMGRLFAAMADLLKAMVQAAMEQRHADDEEEEKE